MWSSVEYNFDDNGTPVVVEIKVDSNLVAAGFMGYDVDEDCEVRMTDNLNDLYYLDKKRHQFYNVSIETEVQYQLRTAIERIL